MTTPAAMAYSGLISLCGLIFIFWHTWHYDHWRCLLFTKQDWFRALMVHILIWSVAFLFVYVWIDVHVLYDEYWVYFPTLDETIVSPFQLWTTQHQNQWKASLYCITAGWGFLQGVHLEEFLYWGYLIKSIRTPGGPKTSWLRSGFFKLWLILFLASFALLIGAVRIETVNLDMMRAYLFCVGSSMGVLLAMASIVLCIVFPSFLTAVRKQGATYEVLERLHFFYEMHQIRTACRLVYSVVFLILSADGLSPAKTVNQSPFWSDLLYLMGQTGLFASTCLSVVVLLPRNMTSESLPPQNETTFHPMVPYKKPIAASINGNNGYPGNANQYFELGERLNVGQDVMAAGLLSPSRNEYGYASNFHVGGGGAGGNGGFEMSITPPSDHKDVVPSLPTTKPEAPFSEIADKSKRARLSEIRNLPNVINQFKSPFETADQGPRLQGPTQVFVTTSHTIVEED